MSAISCEVCQAATDAPLCRPCTLQVANWCRDVPALLAQLEVNITRQSRSGTSSSGGSGEPMMFDVIASERAANLRREVTRYAARLGRALANPIVFPRRPVSEALGAAAVAMWLADHKDALRQQTWAGWAHRDIGAAHYAATHAIEGPPPRRFVGTCPADGCGLAVYAIHAATTARCRCGQTIDVYEATASMLKAAEDRLFPAATLARLLGARGLQIPASSIRSWAHRGDLLVVAVSPEGRPLYRLGPVLELATRQPMRHDASA